MWSSSSISYRMIVFSFPSISSRLAILSISAISSWMSTSTSYTISSISSRWSSSRVSLLLEIQGLPPGGPLSGGHSGLSLLSSSLLGGLLSLGSSYDDPSEGSSGGPPPVTHICTNSGCWGHGYCVGQTIPSIGTVVGISPYLVIGYVSLS